MKKCLDLNQIIVCPICKKKVRIGDTMVKNHICVSCWEKTNKKGE